MKQTDPAELFSWRLTEETMTRRLMAVDRPVLMAKATYPQLVTTETSDEGVVTASAEAAARFNDTYKLAAEHFVTEGMTRIGEEAEAAYCAKASGEGGMFLRWTLTCRMTAESIPAEDGSSRLVRVNTQRTLGKGKRGDTVTREVCVHDWAFPEGILTADEEKPKKPKIKKKIMKNY